MSILNISNGKFEFSETPFGQYMKHRLKELNIDISKDDYIDNPKFQELTKGFICGNGETVTEAWWIEKNLVGQERLERIYSPYMFGIERKLTKDELKDSVWQNVLAERFSGDKQHTVKDVWHYFYRDEGTAENSKKGLIKRLEKIGFYLDDFPTDQDKVKLLFLLYCFENKYHVQIVPFLSNPSIENVDDSFVGQTNKNGDLMAYLKRNIARELPKEYVNGTRDMLIFVGQSWEVQLEKIIIQLDYSVQGEYLEALKKISWRMERAVRMIGEMPKAKYQEPLLNTFYLKLSQHEDLGLEYDIIDVNTATDELSDVIKYRPEEFRRLAYMPINKADLVSFLRDNKEDVICFVYEKDDITSYERKRYDVVVEKLPNFIAMLDLNTKAITAEKISKLYAIVYMQEILRLDKKYKIENSYYRYKTSELKSLNTELNYGTEAKRKSQIALIKRVNKRFYKYAGKPEEAKYAMDAEIYMDMIISRIYEANSLEDMLYIHNLFLNYTDTIFLLDEQIEAAMKRLKKVIGRKQKGYEWEGDSETMRYFLGTIYNSPIIDDLGKEIGKRVFDAELKKRDVGYSWPIELTDNYIGTADNYQLDAVIDTEEKKIRVLGFHLVADKKQQGIFERNGIKIIK